MKPDRLIIKRSESFPWKTLVHNRNLTAWSIAVWLVRKHCLLFPDYDFSLFPLTDPGLLQKGQANSAQTGSHFSLCVMHQLPFFIASVKTLVGCFCSTIANKMPLPTHSAPDTVAMILLIVSFFGPRFCNSSHLSTQGCSLESTVLHGLLSYPSTKSCQVLTIQ